MNNESELWYTWPDWAKDACVVDVDVRLSWRDALRILVRRRLTVGVKTFTENVIGRADSLSRVAAPNIWPRRPVGLVQANAPLSVEERDEPGQRSTP